MTFWRVSPVTQSVTLVWGRGMLATCRGVLAPETAHGTITQSLAAQSRDSARRTDATSGSSTTPTHQHLRAHAEVCARVSGAQLPRNITSHAGGRHSGDRLNTSSLWQLGSLVLETLVVKCSPRRDFLHFLRFLRLLYFLRTHSTYAPLDIATHPAEKTTDMRRAGL
jgi:hypothetical protein